MFYHVTQNHTPKQDPIRLKKGDRLNLGEEDQYWKNWIDCTTEEGCQQGWVPAQLIQPLEGQLGKGLMVEDYDATELAATKDDVLVSEKELNQWLWCRNRDGLHGWVPVENVSPFHLVADHEVELRLLSKKDAVLQFQLIEENRHHLREWLAWVDDTTSIDVVQRSIEGARKQAENNQGVQAGIWYRGQLAGRIGHHHIDWKNRHTSVGYWLSQGHTGKGIMTRACEALVRFSLEGLGLNRVEIRCAVGNEKSRAIPERLGFVQEGTLHQVEWLYDHYVDHVVYSRLKC